jgi:toluene monooxygenase system protein D
MTENSAPERFVGPVMKASEIGEAVIEAIQEDNEGRKIEIEEHESYYRVKVEGECLISFATVSEVLGRDVQVSDIEQNMPSFEGFIRVTTDQMRFLSKLA